MVDIPGTLPEEFAAKFAASFTAELAKTTFQGLKGWLSTEAKKHDLFGTALNAYKDGVERRYDSMKILGMREPTLLRDIYVRVNILEKISSTHRVTTEGLEEFFQRDQRGFGQVEETKEGVAVFNDLQSGKLTVLGKPGAGKTTFLKHLTLQALDGTLRENYLPIFVSLKEWSETEMSLMDFLADQFDICGLPGAKPFVEHLLTAGRCLILLDGLDEVTSDVDRTIRAIKDFSDKYHRNRFVLSCRIAAYDYVFEHFTEVEMADFNDEQIQTFIANWFRDEEETAQQCWKQLNTEEHAPIKELAATPILLTLLCLTYHEQLDFPPNRAELYREAIDVLLKKWDTSRRIRRDQVYRRLTLKRKELMLSQIAFQTFMQGHYFFPRQQLERDIAAYIGNLPDAPEDSVELDSEAILKAIEAQHGLFVERANGIYSFSHLSFQEYFVAKYITEHRSHPTVQELVQERMFDEGWREVWQLVVGMRAEPDEVVVAMRAHIANQLMTKKERDFINLIGEFERKVGRRPTEGIRPLEITRWMLEVARRRGINKTGNMIETLARIMHDDIRDGPLTKWDDARTLEQYYGFRPTADETKEFITQIDALLDANVERIGKYATGTTLLLQCLRPEFDVSKRLCESLLEGLIQEPWEPLPPPFSYSTT